METNKVLVTTRRTFLGAAAGAALVRSAPAGSLLTTNGIGTEIRRRARAYLGERYLVVDYYRIRRKLAYALPVESLSVLPGGKSRCERRRAA